MDENTTGSGMNEEPKENTESGTTSQTGNGNYQYTANDQQQTNSDTAGAQNSANANTGAQNSSSNAGNYSGNGNANSSNSSWNGNNNNAGNGGWNGNGGNNNNGWNTNNNWNTNGNNGNHNGGKKRNHKKAWFAVLLCVIFGFCAGFGGYGISRLSTNSLTKDTKTEASADEGASTSREITDDHSDEESSDTTSEDTEEEETTIDSTDEDTEAAATEGSTESSDESDGTSLTQHHEAGQESNVTKVAAKVLPSIVSVYNNYTQQSQDFFGQTYSSEETATGSGIIIAKTSDELLIVTNNHVVADEDSLQVQFIDETTAEANIKGTDSDNDLAVIAVSLKDLDKDTLDKISVAELGDSDELLVGQSVIAIGNALGYGQSVTVGVVSALNRELETEDGLTNTYIQTDAAINPGNSGGALCDENGYVVGINSSKLSATQVEGMCYAIPISRAIPIIENLMNETTKTKVAEADRGYLGISGVSVTSQVASAYNMPEGVYVSEIIDGGGAADSDLRAGDIITAIDKTTVTSMEDLQKQLTYYAAGDTVTLTVERQTSGGYKETSVDVTLGDSSTIENAQKGSSRQSGRTGDGSASGDSSDESSSDESTEQSDESSSEESTEESSESGNAGGYNQFPWNQW